MAAHNNHLLRMFTAAHFTHNIGGIHRAAAYAILHIDLHAHLLTLIKKAGELLLVFSNHAYDGNFIIRVKAHSPGVSKVHACGKSAALPANDGYSMSVMRFFQEVAKLGKAVRVWRRRSAFFH